MKVKKKYVITAAAVLVVSGGLLCGFTIAGNSKAKEKEPVENPYFVNALGAEMTKEQYLNLLNGFTPDEIDTMPSDVCGIYADDTTLTTTAERGPNDVFFTSYPEKVEMTFEEYKTLVEKDFTPDEINGMTQDEFNSAAEP